MRKKTCLICGSKNKKLLFETSDQRYELVGLDNKKYSLVKCSSCDFVYLDFVPHTKKEFSAIYPTEYWQTGANSKLEKYILEFLIWVKYRKILKYKKRGKLLDVGCGTGEFLSFFQKRGWGVYGQDISLHACNEARKKMKNIFYGPLQKTKFNNNYFDLVFLNSVLHQMTDPLTELLFIRKIINKDGILVISVPNIDSWQYKLSKAHWFHLDSPRHLFYFQPNSISEFLKKADFKIKEVNLSFEECPLDLFHSLRDCLPKIIYPIFLPTSLILRVIPNFRGAMEVIAYPA